MKKSFFIMCCLVFASLSIAGGNKFKHGKHHNQYNQGYQNGYHNGGGFNGYGSSRRCIAVLRGRRGRPLQRFRARSCRQARRQCLRAKFRPRQYCDVRSGGGYGGGYPSPGPGYPYPGYPGGGVSRVCYVDKLNVYGGFAGSYSGVGYANSPWLAQQEACRKAMNQCVRFKSYNQRCVRR